MLIIAEGEIRSDAEGEMPALELFDGPLFALARELRSRGTWPRDVVLYIVTSSYGLVRADRIIRPYRRPMTAARAAAAIYENFGRLAAALATVQPLELMLALPEVYRRALIRKDTPQVQGVPVAYLDVEEAHVPEKLLTWLTGQD